MTVYVEVYLTSGPGTRPDDACSHAYELPNGVIPSEGDHIAIVNTTDDKTAALGRVRKINHLMGNGFYKVHVCVDPISTNEFDKNYKD